MKFLKTKAPDRIILFEIGIILSLLAVNYILGIGYYSSISPDPGPDDTQIDSAFVYVPMSDPIVRPEDHQIKKQDHANIFDPTTLIKQVNDLFKIDEPKMPSVMSTSTGILPFIPVKTVRDTSIIIDEFTADVLPQFPGGPAELQRYIRENYNIPYSIMSYADEVSMQVQFMVNMEGVVTDIQILNCSHPGFGAEREARRVYRNMPKWSPAKYKGHPAKIILIQPFKIKIN
jgi:hypothetical protein